ncbi:hypothetical protein [Anaplasma phagocytophilum]|uniref:hypothetical protein n=1 Tax=Anaplasma phagocytophilum TaxID=948 RepID=UPI00200FB929|nr:hypothetical protein [Anaplasma phagocytophilum]UQD54095.1 hypothetical protein ESP60_01255 [Anaplasma phagocytophilum]
MSEEIIYPMYVLCMLSDVPSIVECAEKTYIQAGYIRLSRWARSECWSQSDLGGSSGHNEHAAY